MKIYGLAGFPLTHSFSKRYFTQKFNRERLNDVSYENFELENISDLLKIIRDNHGICGINVTIPYKESVLEILDEVEETAAAIGAVNTIQIVRDQQKIKLKGFNTDYIGFEKSIQPFLTPNHRRALILGTGGSSNAVAYALAKLGISFRRVSRSTSEVDLHYKELTPQVLLDYQIIINCTPLGMYPEIDSFPKILYQALTAQHLLFDLIYNPEETVFLKKGKEHGAATKNGFEMLSIQAEHSWLIWNLPN